ncbi:MAG: hypothetical protein JXR64_13765 [Spirochaetales bacterium]|nr:hypothetical protein [Spirochaetales bacterium]
MEKENIKWVQPNFEISSVTTGDMPGDKVKIDESHIKRANVIFSHLLEKVKSSNNKKTVISVFGGSGVGKSEIGSLIAHYFKLEGFGTYVLSGDNYPHRIPMINDKERLEIYNKNGREGLEKYLGTSNEIEFELINSIISDFKNGEKEIDLKRMGRTLDSIYFENVNFEKTDILVIEWTHGNNRLLNGVDFPIFLYSTPEETLQHRKSRARDNEVDSPFTKIVLEIEQNLLNSQYKNTELIISKNGEIITKVAFSKIIGVSNE